MRNETEPGSILTWILLAGKQQIPLKLECCTELVNLQAQVRPAAT